MIALKFLERGAVGRFSGFAWPQPSADHPGDWVTATDEVRRCYHGVHASLTEDMLNWLDDELWKVELDGDITVHDGMLVAGRGRLLRRVDAWNAQTASAFAADCALRARHRALGALRRVGLTEEAERLVRAAGLREVQAAAAAATEATTDPDAAELTGYVADAIGLATGRRPDAWRNAAGGNPPITQTAAATAANVAFVVAHVAGREAATATPDDPGSYQAAFDAERATQIAWLTTAGVIDASVL
jgi:hypothetical protein